MNSSSTITHQSIVGGIAVSIRRYRAENYLDRENGLERVTLQLNGVDVLDTLAKIGQTKWFVVTMFHSAGDRLIAASSSPSTLSSGFDTEAAAKAAYASGGRHEILGIVAG
jgi:hypothetical protein